MHMHPDRIGRLAIAALAAAIGLSVLTNAGAYPIDPGGGGTPPPPAGDVTPTPTTSTSSSPSRAVQLADRKVRLVSIATHRLGFMPDVGICCTVDGATVDLASVTGINAGAQLAVDRLGKLSLVWEQFTTMRDPSHQVRIVELDTRTLQPSGAVETVPGLTWSTVEAIACGSTCRLVVRGRAAGATRADLYAWAPGEVAATALRLPGSSAASPAHVLSARDDADRLVIAYTIGNRKPVKIAVLPLR